MPSRPESGLQEVVCTLAGICSDILATPVSEQDNILRLGGHSLPIMRIVNGIRAQFHCSIGVQDVFSHPTIGALAEIIHRQQSAVEPGVTPAEDDQQAPLETTDRAEQPMDDDSVFPASPFQESIWLHERLGAGDGAYNLSQTIRLSDGVALDALQAALQSIVDRHDVLRTGLIEIDGALRQQVYPRLEIPLAQYEAGGWPADGTSLDDRLTTALQAEARAPFCLSSPPLARFRAITFNGTPGLLQLTFHHCISDARSQQLFRAELEQAYCGLSSGLPSPRAACSYRLFTRQQAIYLSSEEARRSEAFWLAHLSDAPASLEFPTGRARPAVQSLAGDRAQCVLAQGLRQELERLALQQSASLYQVLLTAFNVLLYRHLGQQDIVLGVPVSCRSETAHGEGLGLYVNMVPVRSRLDGGGSFLDALVTVQKSALQSLAHRAIPFERLVKLVNPHRSQSYPPIFQITFAAQHLQEPDASRQWPFLGAVTTPVVTSKYDMSLEVTLSKTSTAISIDYATALFDKESIVVLLESYERILRSVVANPTQTLDRLRLLSFNDERRLLDAFDNRTTACPVGLVHQFFEARAAEDGERCAVFSEGVSHTYGKINAEANRLAKHLRRRGVGHEAKVAVCMDRSVDLVVALLAILKAGGAYIPIDPSLPKRRIAAILDDARPQLVLTSGAGADALERIADQNPPILHLNGGATGSPWDDEADGDLSYDRDGAPADRLAYIIYTSGSSGEPKGVAIEHRALVNLLASFAVEPGIARDDVVLALTSVAFDIAFLEIFLPLSNGASVILMPARCSADAAAIDAAIREQAVTLVQATPATWRLLLANGWKGGPELSVWSGGEALTADLAEALLARCARLWNLYGPTETTVWSMISRISQADCEIGLGRPIANTSIRLLNSELTPAPRCAVGEIYIGGTGLARGYHDRPQLTADRFIDDPFHDGGRLYRTGDLARWTPDGRLIMLGRADSQVKIRGFRVELEGVEAHIRSVKGVKDAVVTVDSDHAGGDRLIGYYSQAPGMIVSPAQIRRALLDALPAYMAPQAFFEIAEIPRTISGKVNRRELPLPERRASISRLPLGYLEEVVLSAFSTVLGGENTPNVEDSFFAMGGHSILATILCNRLSATLGMNVPLRIVFEEESVERIARAIELSAKAPPKGRPVRLRAGGPRSPLFCIHAASGFGRPYLEIVKYVHPERSVYAIEARGLETQQELPASIAELSADYIEQIQSIQDEGPYKLLGWSFGAIAAHAIAVEMQRRGLAVDALVLIDGNPLRDDPLPENVIAAHREYLWSRLADDSVFAAAADTDREKMVSRLSEIHRNNLKLSYYLPEGNYDGPAMMVVSKGNTDRANTNLLESALLGPITTVVVPVHHNKLLTPPALSYYGDKLSAWVG